MFGIKIIEEAGSGFNKDLRVVKPWFSGAYIQSGGLTQSGGIVEAIWKRTLLRIKKKNINSVLILGLGGGTIVKIINQIWPRASVVGVDIDSVIVDLGVKYLGLNRKGVEIKIGDAGSYLIKNKRKFDLIIVDLYHGHIFPEKFAKKDFLVRIRKSLQKGGVAVFNRLFYGDKMKEAENFGFKLQEIFDSVERFYPVANIMFLSRKLGT